MPNLNTRKNRHSILNPVHWKIKNKIMLLILLVSIFSVGSITIFSYFTRSQNNQTRVGEEMVAIANKTIQHSADIIEGNVNSLEVLALSPSIIEAVEQANQTYQGRTQADIDAEIAVLDKAWKDKDPSVDTLVNNIANHPVSNHLKAFMHAFPKEVEVFLTDIQGLNVAMTDRTGDYLQADEEWWQSAYNNGHGAIFIGEVDYDDTAGVWAIDIGIPVRDKNGQEIIGVLRGTVSISVIFNTLSQITFGETGYAALLDSEGKILYAHNSDLLLSQAPDTIQTAVTNSTEGWRSDLTDLEGTPAVIAFRQLEGDLGKALGWTILLEKDQQEVNAPVQKALINSLFIAALITVLMVVAGMRIVRFISQPLTIVTHQAQYLSVGDVSHNEDQAVNKFIDRGDELGELLRTFQNLREYLQDMVGSAQHLANGNLSISVNTRGERDVLGNAFNQMITNLCNLVRQVTNGANNLTLTAQQLATASDQTGQAVGQIAASITDVAAGNTQQTASITRAAALVEQVNRAITGVSQGAQAQTVAVQKSSDTTNQISRAIKKVTDNVQLLTNVRESVGSSARKVREMGKLSAQIEAIIETIEDIAGQTNLLALNAAIETARSGMQADKMAEQLLDQQMAIQAHLIAELLSKDSNWTPTFWSHIAHRIGIDNICITDEDGVVTFSNEAGLIGFRFPDDPKSQAFAFRKLLYHNSGVVCQKAKPRSVDNKVFKYVGVSRRDQPGIIQVGFQIDRLARLQLQIGGFAVVTKEVRRLAEKSAEAAHEISQLIKVVQYAVDESVTTMEGSVMEVDRQVEQITDVTQEMSASSNELVNAMNSVLSVIEKNNATTEAMTASSGEMTETIEILAGTSEENSAAAEEVSTTTQEINAQVEEVTASVQSMSQLAQSLQSLMSQFQLTNKQ